MGTYSFSFAHPWILLLLVIIPIMSYLFSRKKIGNGLFFSMTSRIVATSKVNKRKYSSGWFRFSYLYPALICLIFSLARPQSNHHIQNVSSNCVDIMLILDISGSMQAEDYELHGEHMSRLDIVKYVTKEFIQTRTDDRIGIIAFAGRPYLISPLTLDHDWLLYNLERMRIGLVEDGTAIGSALASGIRRFQNQNTKTKIIVLLTDGANNAGKIQPITAAETARVLGIKIYTIGAGTNGPVRVPIKDIFGNIVYQNFVFEFDENLLKEIAKIGNGCYFRATDTDSLQKTFHEIDRLEKTKIDIQKSIYFDDFFSIPLLLAIVFVILEIILSLIFKKSFP